MVQKNQEWKPLTSLIGDGLQAELCRQLTLRTDFFFASLPRNPSQSLAYAFILKQFLKNVLSFIFWSRIWKFQKYINKCNNDPKSYSEGKVSIFFPLHISQEHSDKYKR